MKPINNVRLITNFLDDMDDFQIVDHRENYEIGEWFIEIANHYSTLDDDMKSLFPIEEIFKILTEAIKAEARGDEFHPHKLERHLFQYYAKIALEQDYLSHHDLEEKDLCVKYDSIQCMAEDIFRLLLDYDDDYARVDPDEEEKDTMSEEEFDKYVEEERERVKDSISDLHRDLLLSMASSYSSNYDGEFRYHVFRLLTSVEKIIRPSICNGFGGIFGWPPLEAGMSAAWYDRAMKEASNAYEVIEGFDISYFKEEIMVSPSRLRKLSSAAQDSAGDQ